MNSDAPNARRPAGAWSLTVEPGIVLDGRRAAWLPTVKILALADTHLGFAWVQRRRGQLLPLTDDDTVPRLRSLLTDYPAQTVAILGDVVHQAVAVDALRDLLRELCEAVVRPGRVLCLVLGNHDSGLIERVAKWHLPVPVARELSLPGWQLVHGDQPVKAQPDAMTLSGHEHPCVTLGDGVATRAKVPAFLLGKQSLLLPAFSSWAAGTSAHPGGFSGPVANASQYSHAIACLGPRLLRLPFPVPTHPVPGAPPVRPRSG